MLCLYIHATSTNKKVLIVLYICKLLYVVLSKCLRKKALYDRMSVSICYMFPGVFHDLLLFWSTFQAWNLWLPCQPDLCLPQPRVIQCVTHILHITPTVPPPPSPWACPRAVQARLWSFPLSERSLPCPCPPVWPPWPAETAAWTAPRRSYPRYHHNNRSHSW